MNEIGFIQYDEGYHKREKQTLNNSVIFMKFFMRI